jgi:hypothetical protein
MTQSKNAPSSRLCISLCLAPVLLILALPYESAADEYTTLPPSLTPGTRIRIQAPEVFSGKVVGTVNAVDADSVTVDVPGRPEPVSVLRAKIARLDVSEGPRSRGVDAAIGAGIGAGIGAIGGALANSNRGSHIVSRGETTAVCALLGTGVGAPIGAAIPPGEHWKPISAERYRVGLEPGLTHGLNLVIAWKF